MNLRTSTKAALSAAALLTSAAASLAADPALIPPYPLSAVIAGITMDLPRISIGHGDNWANTWGDDNRIYTFFTDRNGCFRPSLVYNPGLQRYLLVMSSPFGKWKWWANDNPDRRPHLGIFDAPNPWGPWPVAAYEANWGAPENWFAPNIPSKWINETGTNFHLLYSCIPNGPYQFNVQRCAVKLKGP